MKKAEEIPSQALGEEEWVIPLPILLAFNITMTQQFQIYV